MAFRPIPNTSVEYGLLSFDAQGNERLDDVDERGRVMSAQLIDRAASGDVTNIFMFAHGWNGDMGAAKDQFDRWISALESHTADRERAGTVFPGFSPLYVGVHWPSLWLGDESLHGTSFSTDDAPRAEDALSMYLECLGDTPSMRAAVSTILAESRTGRSPSPETTRAFEAIEQELDLSPAADADGMNLKAASRTPAASFGAGGGAGLGLLRTLSYFSMKKRARVIGEGAVHTFVRALQRATADRATPIHVMGHSFGCVVMSAALGGPGGRSPLERPIDSAALIQGAVSLWAYATDIPHEEGPGYFHDVLNSRKVRGPLITTRSRLDMAVRIPYTVASRVSGAVAFGASDGDAPRYGAVGFYGLRGLPTDVVVDAKLAAADQPCDFECGKVYNLEASKFICSSEGAFVGAHNDIGGPQVAHAVWEAAFASAQR